MQTATRADDNFPPRRRTAIAAPADFPPPRRPVISEPEPRPGFLYPTYTSVAVSGASGLIAAFSAAAAPLSLSGEIGLGLMVAGGTYLGVRAGKLAGKWTGDFLGTLSGGIGGGIIGAAAGALNSEPKDRTRNLFTGAAMGATAGGYFGSIVLSAVGAFGGFWLGGYEGHGLTRDISLKYVFMQSVPQENILQLVPVEKAPRIDAPAPR